MRICKYGIGFVVGVGTMAFAMGAMALLCAIVAHAEPALPDDAETTPAVFCDTAEQAAFLIRTLHAVDDDVIAAVRAANRHFPPTDLGGVCTAGEATYVQLGPAGIVTDDLGSQFGLWNIVVFPQPGNDLAPIEQVGIFPLAGSGI